MALRANPVGVGSLLVMLCCSNVVASPVVPSDSASPNPLETDSAESVSEVVSVNGNGMHHWMPRQKWHSFQIRSQEVHSGVIWPSAQTSDGILKLAVHPSQ